MYILSFDLDNTIVFQDHTAKKKNLQRALERAGYYVDISNLSDATKLANQYFDSSAHLYSKEPEKLWHDYSILIAKTIGLNELKAKKVIETFYNEYNRNKDNFYLLRGIYDYLIKLYENGFSLNIISNNIDATQRIDFFKLKKIFKQIFTVKHGRSKTQLYQDIINKYLNDYKNIIHIGDDIIADYFIPRKLGIYSILLDISKKYTRVVDIDICISLDELKRLLSKITEFTYLD